MIVLTHKMTSTIIIGDGLCWLRVFFYDKFGYDPDLKNNKNELKEFIDYFKSKIFDENGCKLETQFFPEKQIDKVCTILTQLEAGNYEKVTTGKGKKQYWGEVETSPLCINECPIVFRYESMHKRLVSFRELSYKDFSCIWNYLEKHETTFGRRSFMFINNSHYCVIDLTKYLRHNFNSGYPISDLYKSSIKNYVNFDMYEHASEIHLKARETLNKLSEGYLQIINELNNLMQL